MEAITIRVIFFVRLIVVLNDLAKQYIEQFIPASVYFHQGMEWAEYPRKVKPNSIFRINKAGRKFRKSIWDGKKSIVQSALEDWDRWFFVAYQHCPDFLYAPEFDYLRTDKISFLALDVDNRDFTVSGQKAFWQKIKAIHDLGIPGIWYQSPGNEHKGTIVHGAYFLISLNGQYSIEELEPLRDKIRAAIGFNIETNIDQSQYRPPGQWNMPLLSLDIDHEIFKPISINGDFGSFLTEWAKRPITDMQTALEILPDAPAPAAAPQAPRKKVLRQIKNPPVAAKVVTPSPVKKKKSGRLKADDCKAIKCTQKVTAHRVGELVRQFHGDPNQLENIVALACADFVDYRPDDSVTAADPQLTEAIIRRNAKNMLGLGGSPINPKTGKPWYDPTKCKVNIVQQEEDAKRIAVSLKIIQDHTEDMVRQFKKLNPTKRDIQIFIELMSRVEDYFGRVADVVICGGDNSFCTREEWHTWRNKYEGGVVGILVGHSKELHLCRQWGFADDFIYSVLLLTVVREGNKQILECERKKNSNIYSNTHPTARHPTCGPLTLMSEIDQHLTNWAVLPEFCEQ